MKRRSTERWLLNRATTQSASNGLASWKVSGIQANKFL